MNIKNPKYKLGEKHPEEDLYRVVALRDFGDVKAGDIGGWVEWTQNLSHEGDCWVYDEARIYDNAHISENARVSGEARIYCKALVCGNARVYEKAHVYEKVQIYGDARVHGYSHVWADAQISGIANISEFHHIHTGHIDSGPSIEDLLRCSFGCRVVDGVVRLYKRVSAVMSSEFYPTFIYPESGLVEAEEVDEDPTIIDGAGLHFTFMENCTVWKTPNQKILAADIRVEDIIIAQAGVVRCRKATIVGVVE